MEKDRSEFGFDTLYPKYKSKPERKALFGMPKILYPRRLLYSLIVPVLVIDKCAGFNNNK